MSQLLELSKIVEILEKIKQDDVFYFKNYCPEIIESYSDQNQLLFGKLLLKKEVKIIDENSIEFENKLYSLAEFFILFKKNAKI